MKIALWRSSAVKGVGGAESGRETWSLGKAVRTLSSLQCLDAKGKYGGKGWSFRRT